jgi:exosome complex component RRP45
LYLLFVQVEKYTTEKALKKVKRLPASVSQKISVPYVTMTDKSEGESEKQSEKTLGDVQKISKGDQDHKNIKRDSPLTGSRIAKHKQLLEAEL